MVEAGGTAPPSCLVFGLYQQTVSYLYHSGIQMSIDKFSWNAFICLPKNITIDF
jgi:hypothetical protein